jgi:hypothetical protein
MTTNLDYRSPAIDPREDRSLRVLARLLWICAVLPMTLGLLVVFLFALIDQEWLVYVGLLLLPIGTLVVITGLGLLLAWILRRQGFTRRGAAPTNRLFPLGMGALLLSNFGVAVLCMFLGVNLIAAPRLSIVIENETGAAIDVCRVNATWFSETKTTLADKSLTWFHYRLGRVSKIGIHLEQGGQSLDLAPPVPPPPGPGQSNPTIHYRIRPGLAAVQTSDPGFLRD